MSDEYENIAQDKDLKIVSRIERQIQRILVVSGIISILLFCFFLFRKEHIGYLPLFGLLCISLIYKFIKILFEWYHYWSVKIPVKPPVTRLFTVDMLTTSVAGEPVGMIKNTLTRMKQVHYPHTTWLCDEGNDPELRDFCACMDIRYVTRTDKSNAKAGNINNALRSATGEICVVLDPDHAPAPEFLDEILPYFENPEIGFVQIVQAYKNVRETMIAKGAAQQTYIFYGPMMMCMNSYGTVQAIGANCTFRRAALNSIGGHSAGLAEDMHTAMQLYAAGWKSVYIPKILTRGLVPASLSAYFKQQFKWSRGTFELLIHVYPRLFKKFTWRQKLHYFLVPLHYAVGLIILIDILIPVLSLFSGLNPLQIDLKLLGLIAIQMLLMILLIRQYAQRWLIEKYEYGLHITGGVLLFSTWWIYVSGFIYTLFGKKVPYIPTPKAAERKNILGLVLPNLIVCFIILAAMVYGLLRDWTPYSLIMAGFCLLNLIMLGIVILAGQHYTVWSLRQKIARTGYLRGWLRRLRKFKIYTSEIIFNPLRLTAPVIVGILLPVIYFLPFYTEVSKQPSQKTEFPADKNAGGFYFGLYMPALQKHHSFQSIDDFEKKAAFRFQIISIYERWGPEGLKLFPMDLLQEISGRGAIPMITWEPWVSGFPLRKSNPGLRNEKKGMKAISDGLFDNYIRGYALKIRDYRKPVFIRFAQEPDNPAYPWSRTGGNTSEDYKASWRKIVSLFAELGVGNVSWVYNPWDPLTMISYYPGDQYVDWVGLTGLNYGTASSKKKWITLEEIYEPFRNNLLPLHKPVMLAEFGSTNYGGDGTAWVKKSLSVISNRYPEIKSVVFFNSDEDKNWITAWRPEHSTGYVDWSIKDAEEITNGLKAIAGKGIPWTAIYRPGKMLPVQGAVLNEKKSTFLKGGPGLFTWLVEGKPFYVRGIAYNSGQGWPDINYQPTRRQLEKDFREIRNEGANTIRSYQPSFFDKNILTVADEYGLKVLYGFWFDPAIDYYQDSERVKKYIRQTVERVSACKSYHAVLGWSVGNETGGLLKKYYNQPYLSRVREAYMQMVETIAIKIHQTDPGRPVLTSLEHSWQLPAELQAFHLEAPSIDIMGINSYYKKQIGDLQELTHRFDSTRPYLVSEFGPEGYWNDELTKLDTHQMISEAGDRSNALWYQEDWKNNIMKNSGYNVGGIAYTWRDRFEGSATWFGITDYKGRKKSVYYALQNTWKNGHAEIPKSNMFIIGPDFKVMSGTEYIYSMVNHDPAYKNIEWKMYSTDYAREIKIKNANDLSATIRLPDKPGNYRLYVYAGDDNGRVMTASKSVQVFSPQNQKE